MSVRVVVIGGGYAGVSAARMLHRSRSDMDVTVVNPRAQFVERIRLHEFAFSDYRVVHRLRDLLPTSASLLIDTVASISPEDQVLQLASGQALAYDWLIYALGSSSPRDAVAGATSDGFGIGDISDARACHAQALSLLPGSVVSIVGGGLTGVETAAEIAHARPDISVRLLTSGTLTRGLGNRARSKIETHLRTIGVEVHERAHITAVSPQSIVLEDGSERRSDLTVFATSTVCPPLARHSGLATHSDGALVVNEYLESVSSPRILAAGDAAALTGGRWRMSCQAAIPTGVHAAAAINNRISGRQPRRIATRFATQSISLGRRNGVQQLTTARDEPYEWGVFTGRAAAIVKEQICRSTLHFGQFGPLSTSWTSRGE